MGMLVIENGLMSDSISAAGDILTELELKSEWTERDDIANLEISKDLLWKLSVQFNYDQYKIAIINTIL